MFEGRLPAQLQDRAPHIVDTADGLQIWEFEDQQFTQVGMNAIAGRRPETVQVRAVPLRRRCVPAATTSTPVSATWISAGSGRR